MFIITKEYKYFKLFFAKLEKKFTGSSSSFTHIYHIIIALACLSRPKATENIVVMFNTPYSRQALEKFFNNSECDFEGLLMNSAFITLRKLGWKKHEPLFFIIDDTQITKTGNKKTEAADIIYHHSKGCYSLGYVVLTCAFVYRGIVVPCSVRLWLSQDSYVKLTGDSEKAGYQKLTELAADCIRSLALPEQTPVVVLFDRFFLCKTVVDACNERGFHYIGAVKKNRVFYPEGKENIRQKVAQYAPNYLKGMGVYHKIEGCSKDYYLASRRGSMKHLGDIRLVMSRRRGEKDVVTFATNLLDVSEKTIIEFYRNRWYIEVLFKEAKQYLGLGDSELTKYRAAVRYLHLVMCAHCLLTHQAYSSIGDNKSTTNNNTNLKRFGTLAARQIVLDSLDEEFWETLCKSKVYGESARKVRAKFERVKPDSANNTARTLKRRKRRPRRRTKSALRTAERTLCPKKVAI